MNNLKRKIYMREYLRKYSQAHPEKVKQWKDKWKDNNLDKVKKSKLNWAKKNPQKVKEARYTWKVKNPDKVKEMNKRYWKDRYQINLNKSPSRIFKIKTRSKANYKIQINRGEKCAICKHALATEKHHEDYSLPLDVKKLCHNCHRRVHHE